MQPADPLGQPPLLRFSTHDPEEFEDRMTPLAEGLSCFPARPGGMMMDVCGAMLPGVVMFNATLENFSVQSEARSFYGVTIPLMGGCEAKVNDRFEQFHESRMHVQDPDRTFAVRMRDEPLRSLQVCVDATAFREAAGRLLGSGRHRVTIQENIDLGTVEAGAFARQATFTWGEIMRNGAVVQSPLVAKETANHLIALLLAAVVAEMSSDRRGGGTCGTKPIRRAEEFLRAHLRDPVSVADTAKVAGVSARTLSREFRRLHGTTIKGFLKQRRLEAANRTLLSAEPGEMNVTQVALEFGFEQLGRFAGDYRQQFGELPSETLGRRGSFS